MFPLILDKTITHTVCPTLFSFVCINSFSPHNNPCDRCYYYPHFTDEKAEAQRG